MCGAVLLLSEIMAPSSSPPLACCSVSPYLFPCRSVVARSTGGLAVAVALAPPPAKERLLRVDPSLFFLPPSHHHLPSLGRSVQQGTDRNLEQGETDGFQCGREHANFLTPIRPPVML